MIWVIRMMIMTIYDENDADDSSPNVRHGFPCRYCLRLLIWVIRMMIRTIYDENDDHDETQQIRSFIMWK